MEIVYVFLRGQLMLSFIFVIGFYDVLLLTASIYFFFLGQGTK